MPERQTIPALIASNGGLDEARRAGLGRHDHRQARVAGVVPRRDGTAARSRGQPLRHDVPHEGS
jgi:hypothetical protein